MSALGQKRTPAVQNSMSALPQKRHQMRHAIGLRAKCNARRLPRKGVGLSGRAMVKRRHLLFRFRHDLRRHWPGQEASSPVVSLSRSQRPCNLWERSLDRKCEPRGSRYAATEAGRDVATIHAHITGRIRAVRHGQQETPDVSKA